jgi:predicted nucleic-acid-binding Zn-ribbon protein
MRSGICPKCNHATVYSGRDIAVKASSGNMLPIDFKHHVALDNYVCVSCGYVENYISDRKALDTIAEQWAEAGKNKKKR